MKSFILIAVLAALTVYNDAASIPNEGAPGQEDVVVLQESTELYQKDYNIEGVTGRLINDADLILFHEESFTLPAVPYTIQRRDVVYRGNSTTQIDRIVISDPPSAPGQIIVENYQTYGNVRVISAPGLGLSCTVSFLGRYTDWL